jgi:hypothetical protein
MREDVADGHGEVENQGKNDEQGHDSPQDPEADGSCPGLLFLLLGRREVFQRGLTRIRPEVIFIGHKRHLFAHGVE